MFRKTLVGLMSLALAGSVLAGCGGSSSSSTSAPKPADNAAAPAQQASKDPVVIGVVTSKTGPNAATGVQVSTGAELAVKEWNAKGGIQGRQIKLVVEDDQGTPTGATTAFQKVMASKPDGLVLPTFSQLVMAIEPALKQAGRPALTSATGTVITKSGDPWFFRLRTNDEVMGNLAANFAMDELKTKKPGILYANNDYGKGGFEVIKGALEAKGIKVVDAEAFNANDKDVSSQLLKLKQAGADLIICWSTPADSAVIAQQQKQISLGIPFLGSPGWGTPEFFDLVKGAADNNYGMVDFIVGSDDASQKFVKTVNDNFKGIPVSFVVSTSYDGTNMMLDTMNKVGTDPQKVRDAMIAIKGYKGITGTYTFDNVGNGLKQAAIFKIENNGIKPFKTITQN